MQPKPPKPPHLGDLIKVIRRLAQQGNLSFTSHALDERMEERDFDADDVLKILAQGEIDGPIEPGRKKDEWRCRVVGNLPWTSRAAGVVAVVVRDERLIIVTVKWIDP
jgi:Domain of unknown function (DUF4258)